MQQRQQQQVNQQQTVLPPIQPNLEQYNQAQYPPQQYNYTPPQQPYPQQQPYAPQQPYPPQQYPQPQYPPMGDTNGGGGYPKQQQFNNVGYSNNNGYDNVTFN